MKFFDNKQLNYTMYLVFRVYFTVSSQHYVWTPQA